jgi:hypothetical protein
VKVFEAFVSIDSAGFTIQPGLSTSCNIILECIEDTVVVPLPAIFEKDSTKIVYVLQDGKYIRQTVELAANSESYAVVAKGLEGSEEIALTEPSEDLIIINGVNRDGEDSLHLHRIASGLQP